MSVMVASNFGYLKLPTMETKLPKVVMENADQHIAASLRCDRSFMNELKRFGIYDEDAQSVVEDELEVVET